MRRGTGIGLLAATPASVFLAAPVAAQHEDCAALADRVFGHATVVTAEEVTPPLRVAGAGMGGRVQVTHPMCRVRGTISPTTRSAIQFEVWLPQAETWNGRYLGTGNGGFAGSIAYDPLNRGLTQGFAVSATDTGHVGTPRDTEWAIGNPERVIDLGWRSLHETTLVSKAVIEAYYGRAENHSYFSGCSTGGRQGLTLAQRFPTDYDGIVVGAPANYWNALHGVGGQIFSDLIHGRIAWMSPAKLRLVNDAVHAQCRSVGGLLEDPSSCRFEPESLLCAEGQNGDSCLTPLEAHTIASLYDGLRAPDGSLLYPGMAPGHEISWTPGIFGREPGEYRQTLKYPFTNGFFGILQHGDPAWTPAQFDVTADLAAVRNSVLGRAVYAENPDLAAFRANGGRILHYHGWHDPGIPARASIAYYEEVAQLQGGIAATQPFYRLFLGTGMEHCGGGPGPNAVGGVSSTPSPVKTPETDVLAAIIRWVENDVAPEQIIATRYEDNNPAGRIVAQRPWCPYPAVARYDGMGDPAQADSYSCQLSVQENVPN